MQQRNSTIIEKYEHKITKKIGGEGGRGVSDVEPPDKIYYLF